MTDFEPGARAGAACVRAGCEGMGQEWNHSDLPQSFRTALRYSESEMRGALS